MQVTEVLWCVTGLGFEYIGEIIGAAITELIGYTVDGQIRQNQMLFCLVNPHPVEIIHR